MALDHSWLVGWKVRVLFMKSIERERERSDFVVIG